VNVVIGESVVDLDRINFISRDGTVIIVNFNNGPILNLQFQSIEEAVRAMKDVHAVIFGIPPNQKKPQ
jgi:glutathione peroxidase-family protein